MALGRRFGMIAMDLGPPDWRKVATVEVMGDVGMLRHVMASPHESYFLQLADEYPSGRTWIDVFVDFGVGELRGAREAQSVLQTLADASTRGNIKPIRIVAGEHWLAGAAIQWTALES